MKNQKQQPKNEQTPPPTELLPNEKYYLEGVVLTQLVESVANLPYRNAVPLINLLTQARPVSELSGVFTRDSESKKSKT